MLDFVWVILYHLRSPTVSPSLVYKFGVDRIYSFGYRHFKILALFLEIA